MATSDITVAALTATGDVKGVKLAWTCADPWPVPFNTSLAAVEVWAATSNDRSHGSFAKVGEGITDFLHSGLNRGDIRYYWIKARDKLGGYGDWHPSGATSGVQGTEVSGDVLIATDGYWKHPSGLIEQWGTAAIDSWSASGLVNVLFPIAFPNQCFQVHLQAATAAFSTETKVATLQTIYEDSFDATVNTVENGGVVNYAIATVKWRALGY